MTTRIATCSCGQLRVTVSGEPVRISVCHCLTCQRRTGSAFGVQARFPETAVRIEGSSKEYVRTADSGKTAKHHFCPECGGTVYFTLELMPDFVAVPVGGFADSAFPAPKISIYESRQHPWVKIAANVEHLE